MDKEPTHVVRKTKLEMSTLEKVGLLVEKIVQIRL